MEIKNMKDLSACRDGNELAETVFTGNRELLIGVKGLDKKPWIYPLAKPAAVNGTYYWLVDKSTMLYGSLSLNTDCQIFTQMSDGTVIRIMGQAFFTEDEKVIKACFNKECEKEITYYIAFLLNKAVIEVEKGSETVKYPFNPADGAFTAITMKKDKEIKERLTKLLEERSAVEVVDIEKQKVTDSILLVLAQEAKKLWPSFSLMPLENSLLYETYDEKEQYQKKAAMLLGNLEIKQVEDITYCLSKAEQQK